MEATLDLLHQPLGRERFTHVLVGFYGFHRAWEPALARQLHGLVPRPRLPLIEHDLLALGLGEDTIRAIAPWATATALGDNLDAALGSLYVLEGSTLGSRVITRHLKQAPWCPAEGLRYFDPYGDDTAAHWRNTLEQLAITGGDPDRVVTGAVRTFEILQRWFDLSARGAGPCAPAGRGSRVGVPSGRVEAAMKSPL